jgi:hypothetical protein
MDSHLEDLARDWRWLFDPAGFEVVAISPFGDLLRDEAGAFRLLDLNFGEIVESLAEGDDPAVLFPESFDGLLAARYRAAGIELREGQCYAFTTPVMAKQGSYEPGNVYAVSGAERISFIGDFHRQIKDIADGETMRIVVRS